MFNIEHSYQDEGEFLQATKEFTKSTEWKLKTIRNARVKHEDEGFFLVTDGETIKLNSDGKYSLPPRAGLGGSVLDELSPEDFKQVLNTCFPYKTGNMLLNILEDEIYAAHSDKYVVISIDEIFETTKNVFARIFPNAKFVGGSISPNFAMAEYSLVNEPEVTQIYEEALKELFSKSFELVAPTIRIVTSNTGDSGINIYPCFLRKSSNGNGFYPMPAGEAIKMEHKGNASIGRFTENIGGSMSLINRGAEHVIKLTYDKIEHPLECFLNLCQRIGLPKNLCIEIAEEMENALGGSGFSTNGKFLYLWLCQILDRSSRKTEKERFDLMCQISRVLTINFREYDRKDCEWLRQRDKNQISFF